MSEGQPQAQVVSDTTQQFQNNESFIATRLNTDPILRKLELFLSSKRVVLKQNTDGSLFEDVIEYGKPMCNDQGLNGLLHITELIINSQTVQGNFDRTLYDDYIYFARRELCVEIVKNRIKWGITSENTQLIIDSIMRFVKPFISRLINNEERKSYIGGFQSREVVVRDSSKKGGLGSFSSFGGK